MNALQFFNSWMRWTRMRNNNQDTHQATINMMHISEHCNKTDHLDRGRNSFITCGEPDTLSSLMTRWIFKKRHLYPYVLPRVGSVRIQCQQAIVPNFLFIVYICIYRCIFKVYYYESVAEGTCNKSVIVWRGNISLCWFLRRLLCISNGPDPPWTTCPPCPLYVI